MRFADKNLFKYITESLEGIKEFTVMNKRIFLVDRCEREHRRKSNAEINYNFVTALSPRIMEAIWIAGIVVVAPIN